PFALDEEGQIVAAEGGAPSISPAMLEWNLQTEPWVYVLDAAGIIATRIEGSASPAELTEALTAILG
ncbi:MAG: hypothetical protein IIB22_00210, partial [Chloroflexi bacterium]|nr:hypothetical protein [Chloroflexota bacterium]